MMTYTLPARKSKAAINGDNAFHSSLLCSSRAIWDQSLLTASPFITSTTPLANFGFVSNSMTAAAVQPVSLSGELRKVCMTFAT